MSSGGLHELQASHSHNQDGLSTLTASHFLLFNAPNAYPEDPRLPGSSKDGTNARLSSSISGQGGLGNI